MKKLITIRLLILGLFSLGISSVHAQPRSVAEQIGALQKAVNEFKADQTSYDKKAKVVDLWIEYGRTPAIRDRAKSLLKNAGIAKTYEVLELELRGGRGAPAAGTSGLEDKIKELEEQLKAEIASGIAAANAAATSRGREEDLEKSLADLQTKLAAAATDLAELMALKSGQGPTATIARLLEEIAFVLSEGTLKVGKTEADRVGFIKRLQAYMKQVADKIQNPAKSLPSEADVKKLKTEVEAAFEIDLSSKFDHILAQIAMALEAARNAESLKYQNNTYTSASYSLPGAHQATFNGIDETTIKDPDTKEAYASVKQALTVGVSLLKQVLEAVSKRKDAAMQKGLSEIAVQVNTAGLDKATGFAAIIKEIYDYERLVAVAGDRYKAAEEALGEIGKPGVDKSAKKADFDTALATARAGLGELSASDKQKFEAMLNDLSTRAEAAAKAGGNGGGGNGGGGVENDVIKGLKAVDPSLDAKKLKDDYGFSGGVKPGTDEPEDTPTLKNLQDFVKYFKAKQTAKFAFDDPTYAYLLALAGKLSGTDATAAQAAIGELGE